jgi:hypothetical protein
MRPAKLILLSPSLERRVLNLYRLGEQGAWYEPSDLSYLYQESTGATPGALNSPVGLIVDKLGRGKNASQATSGARPTLSARYNLFTETEFRNGLADAPVSGDVTGTTFAGLTHGTGIAFGTAGVSAYAYKDNFTVDSGATYRISAYVRMDDGLAPSFGSATAGDASNDFAFVLGGTAGEPNAHVVTALGGGLYHVAHTRSAGAGVLYHNGILKLETNSARTFKVSGYQLDEGAVSRYQRVDATDYDAGGFPARIDYDEVDDALVTTWASSLGTNCTVGRAVAGVGASILTGQTIATTYTDNTDHCGLVIIDRALSPQETLSLTRYLNRKSGL